MAASSQAMCWPVRLRCRSGRSLSIISHFSFNPKGDIACTWVIVHPDTRVNPPVGADWESPAGGGPSEGPGQNRQPWQLL